MSPVYVIHFTRDERIYDRLLIGQEQVVRDILAGDDLPADQIDRIDVYDTDSHFACNVTEDIAILVARHFGADPHREASPEVRDFIETHAGPAYVRGLRVLDRAFA